MQSSKFASYFGGIGHALSARDYRIYWYAHVFSSHGVWMHRMAVGVLIFQLTDSPAWLGFIGFVYSLPLMLLGPIAGAIADRFGIRRTAIIAIVVTIALACLMAGLTLGRVMTPALLAAFVIVLGSVHVFDCLSAATGWRRRSRSTRPHSTPRRSPARYWPPRFWRWATVCRRCRAGDRFRYLRADHGGAAVRHSRDADARS